MRRGAPSAGRSTGTKKASRSSPPRACRAATAAIPWTSSMATAGARRTTSLLVWDLVPDRAGSLFPPAPRSPCGRGGTAWAVGRLVLSWPRERATWSSASPASGRRHHTVDRPPHPHPPGPARGSQAIWALAHQLGHVLLHDTTAPCRAPPPPVAREYGKPKQTPSLHHLHPARRPRRAHLRQPADLGRHRSAGPARRHHPGRR